MQTTEGRFQRLQQFLAKPPACLDRQIGILGNIGNAVEIGNFGVQEIAEEEVLRQPYPAKIFQTLHRTRLSHDVLFLPYRWQETSPGADFQSTRNRSGTICAILAS